MNKHFATICIQLLYNHLKYEIYSTDSRHSFTCGMRANGFFVLKAKV